MLKPKILIVEDEASLRRLCADLLRDAGYDPIVAPDGRQGLEIFRERQGEIRLIVSDIMMPHMNGIEMAESLLKVRADASILFMSGYGFPLPWPQNRFSVLPKPFAPKQLLEAVRNCLAHAVEVQPQAV